MRTALLWAAACALARADQTYYMQVEILPPEDSDDPDAAAVASRLASAVADPDSALHSMGWFDPTKEVKIETSAAEPGIDVESDGDMRVAATGTIDVSGRGLRGIIADEVDILADGAQMRTSDGGIELTSGGEADLRAAGNVAAFATGALRAAAESAATQLTGDFAATIGGAASTSFGGDIAVSGGGSAGLSARDNVWVSGGYVMLEATQGLSASASVAELTGSEKVRVASRGSAVELSGDDDVEYLGYVWRASDSFQQFENVVPRIEGVVEVIVHGGSVGGAQAIASGGATFHIDLGVVDSSTQAVSFTRVWSSTVGAGTYLLDGLHVRIGQQTVDLIRMSAEGGGTYDGWSEVLFHFGRAVGAGTVTVAASNALEAVAGESVSVAAEGITLSAGTSVDVRSKSIHVSSEELNLQADTLTAAGQTVQVSATSSVEVFTGGSLSASGNSMSLHAVDEVGFVAGDVAAVSANVAVIELSELVELSTPKLKVRGGDSVEVYSGESVDVHTGDFTVNAGGTVSAFAGDHAELSTGTAVLDASESVTVHTRDLRVVPSGVVELAATESAKLVASNIDVASTGYTALNSVGSLILGTATGDIEISAGRRMLAEAEGIGVQGGYADVHLEGAMDITTGSTTTVSAVDGLGATTAGDATLAAQSAAMELASNAAARVGGDSKVSVGGSMNLGVSGALSTSASALGLHVGEVTLDSAGGLTVDAADVQLQTVGDIKLATPSSSIRATVDGQLSFVSFTLPGGSGFDDFENLMPTVASAQSVTVRGLHNQALAIASGTRARIQLLDTESGVWFEAWSVVSGDGLVAQGFSRSFPMSDVGGFRLSATPAQNPSFVDWGDTVVTFGVHGGDTLALSTLGVVEVTSAEGLRLESKQVAVSSGDTIEIGSGGLTALRAQTFDTTTADDTIMVAGRDMRLQALDDLKLAAGQRLQVGADSAIIDIDESLSARAGGSVSLSSTTSTASLSSAGTLSLSSATTVDMTAAQALSFSAPSYDMQASDGFSVSTDSAVEIVGAQLLVHTDQHAHVTSDMISIAANTSMEAITGGTMTVDAGAVDLSAAGAISALAADTVALESGAGMSLHSGGAMSLVAGQAALLAATELAITTAYHQLTMGGPGSTLWAVNDTLPPRLDGGEVNSTETSRMDVAAHGDATMTIAEQLTLSARLLAASIQGDADIAIDGGLTLTAADAVDLSAESLDIVSPNVALSAADVTIEVAHTLGLAAAGSVDVVGIEAVSVETATLRLDADHTAHIEAGNSGATLDMGHHRVAIVSDATNMDERCEPPVCALTPAVEGVAAVTEGCDSSTGNQADCYLFPATETEPGLCLPDERVSPNVATCTYRAAVEEVIAEAGSCSFGCTYVAPGTGVDEGCIAATCTLTPADPRSYVAGACAGDGCTYIAPRDALHGAAVTISHSEATHIHSVSAVTVKADELSYDGTLTTSASDRDGKSLSGIVMASGTSLVGTKAKFKTELSKGDIVRPQSGSESRVVVAVVTNSLARLDAAFTRHIAPNTQFMVERPLVHLNRDAAGSFSVTADGRIGIGTSAPGAALQVNGEFRSHGGVRSDGGIRSAMWGLQKVMPYAASPLPRSATVRSHGGLWKLSASAQAMRADDAAAKKLVVEVLVDGAVVGRLWTIYGGAPGVNVAIPADTLVLPEIAAGVHTVTLRHAVDRGAQLGVSDSESVSTVTLEELPFTG